jgi:ribokinase
MALWNLGSINADMFYDLPHLPKPGETLAAMGFRRGLGGKGANISVAAARAAARTYHIGAVGPDGAWAAERLLEYGVDTQFIAASDVATGHALIYVAADGENQIVIHPGANREIPEQHFAAALSQADAGDWFVTQNETNAQSQACSLAKSLGLKIAYVAAPFEAKAVRSVLAFLDLLILNEGEAAQMMRETGSDIGSFGVSDVLVTLGEKGCDWYGPSGLAHFDAIPVEALDTTGAGDTFAGYVLACLDRGQPMEQAIRTAIQASALMVTRRGTADVIPDLKDVQDFRRV